MRFNGSTLSITGDTTMTGSLTAASKSFDIPHPTKDGFRIRYGSLEGPEHGVYYRGLAISPIITLPDYWVDLVDENTISVQLTPVGSNNLHWVLKTENNQIQIDSENGQISCYFNVYAERKDITKIIVVYKTE
jgi:hypothetical protein